MLAPGTSIMDAPWDAFHFHLILPEDGWKRLVDRSMYFRTLLTFNNARHVSDGVSLADGRMILVSCPAFTDSLAEVYSLLLILSRQYVLVTEVVENFHVPSVLRVLDFFMFDDIWEDLFGQLFSKHWSDGQIDLFRDIFTTYGARHPVVTNLINSVASIHQVSTLSRVRMHQRPTVRNCLALFRSARRAARYEAAVISSYSCGFCSQVFESRNNLPAYSLENGTRYSCCATPICVSCIGRACVSRDRCPFCETYITDDEEYNHIFDDWSLARNRNALRFRYGIPFDAELETFPLPQHPNLWFVNPYVIPSPCITDLPVWFLIHYDSDRDAKIMHIYNF